MSLAWIMESALWFPGGEVAIWGKFGTDVNPVASINLSHTKLTFRFSSDVIDMLSCHSLLSRRRILSTWLGCQLILELGIGIGTYPPVQSDVLFQIPLVTPCMKVSIDLPSSDELLPRTF